MSAEHKKVVINVQLDEPLDLPKPPVLAKQTSSQSDVVIHGVEKLVAVPVSTPYEAMK